MARWMLGGFPKSSHDQRHFLGQDELSRILGTFFPHPIRFRQIWPAPQGRDSLPGLASFARLTTLPGAFGTLVITIKTVKLSCLLMLGIGYDGEVW